jgi:hypothetical protein
VIASGAADLDPAVLVGALLRVLPTLDAPAGNELRERFRQIGIAHMQARKAAQQK